MFIHVHGPKQNMYISNSKKELKRCKLLMCGHLAGKTHPNKTHQMRETGLDAYKEKKEKKKNNVVGNLLVVSTSTAKTT